MIQLILKLCAAFGGTIGFSILYNIPKKHFLWAGLTGTFGWLVYYLLNFFNDPLFSSFGAALFIGIMARILAIRKQCPATIFSIAGLFPLAPGTQIYYTNYYLMTNNLSRAMYQGISTLKIAMAIVMGIVVALSIPQSFFMKMRKKKRHKL